MPPIAASGPRKDATPMRSSGADRWLPFGLFAAGALVLFAAGALSLKYLPLPADSEWRGFRNHLWLDGWVRWDAGWYREIAHFGYDVVRVTPARVQRASHFFPL